MRLQKPKGLLLLILGLLGMSGPVWAMTFQDLPEPPQPSNSTESELNQRLSGLLGLVSVLDNEVRDNDRLMKSSEKAVTKIFKDIAKTEAINPQVADDGDVTGTCQAWIARAVEPYRITVLRQDQNRKWMEDIRKEIEGITARLAENPLGLRKSFKTRTLDLLRKIKTFQKDLRQRLDRTGTRQKDLGSKFERIIREFIRLGVTEEEAQPLRKFIDPAARP